jgi:hypothetical protein
VEFELERMLKDKLCPILTYYPVIFLPGLLENYEIFFWG